MCVCVCAPLFFLLSSLVIVLCGGGGVGAGWGGLNVGVEALGHELGEEFEAQAGPVQGEVVAAVVSGWVMGMEGGV